MSAIPSLGAVPASAYANEPSAIRHGDAKAKQAYATGLGFEEMLLDQVTQQMTDTISAGGDTDAGDGGDGSSDGGSSDSSIGAYSSLMSGSLTQGVMAGGGNGLAMQLAQSLDPSLLTAPHPRSGA